MKTTITIQSLCLAMHLALVLLVPVSCKKENDENPADSGVWDVDNKPLPQFIEVFPIEMDKIQRISRFRSGVGHDYSDFVEPCRSMKHYFEPKPTVDWSQVKVFAPADGKITRVENEWAGSKVEMECQAYPAFRITLFHVNLTGPLQVGDGVKKGQQLGFHFGPATYSDVGCIANDPSKQGRMVSFFYLATNSLMNSLLSRGITKREDLIISRQLRDANPLTCNGDQFAPGDTLAGWVNLNP